MASMRTSKGNVTQAARNKSGMKGHGKKKPFPVFDHTSAMNALKLRHNGKGISGASVIAKVRAWASRNHDKVALAACNAAAQKDRGGK